MMANTSRTLGCYCLLQPKGLGCTVRGARACVLPGVKVPMIWPALLIALLLSSESRSTCPPRLALVSGCFPDIRYWRVSLDYIQYIPRHGQRPRQPLPRSTAQVRTEAELTTASTGVDRKEAAQLPEPDTACAGGDRAAAEARLQVGGGLGQAQGVKAAVAGHGPVQPLWALGVGQPQRIACEHRLTSRLLSQYACLLLTVVN